MKPKPQPQSKIPTTGVNTNQKKKPAASDGMAMDSSLLKKNEFTLIIAGALVVTVLVFFLFFRDTGTAPVTTSAGEGSGGQMDKALEKRVAELEVTLARLASAPSAQDLEGGSGAVDSKKMLELGQRLDRMETAMTLKVDALLGRLNKLERQLAAQKKQEAPAKPAPVVKVSKTESKPVQKAPIPKKTAVQQAPGASMFHTVQKGETLWSISQKYKTSVAAIRKLNNMTPDDKIYPGSNILVR